jgi:hypothetical protein
VAGSRTSAARSLCELHRVAGIRWLAGTTSRLAHCSAAMTTTPAVELAGRLGGADELPQPRDRGLRIAVVTVVVTQPAAGTVTVA